MFDKGSQTRSRKSQPSEEEMTWGEVRLGGDSSYPVPVCSELCSITSVKVQLVSESTSFQMSVCVGISHSNFYPLDLHQEGILVQATMLLSQFMHLHKRGKKKKKMRRRVSHANI